MDNCSVNKVNYPMEDSNEEFLEHVSEKKCTQPTELLVNREHFPHVIAYF